MKSGGWSGGRVSPLDRAKYSKKKGKIMRGKGQFGRKGKNQESSSNLAATDRKVLLCTWAVSVQAY